MDFNEYFNKRIEKDKKLESLLTNKDHLFRLEVAELILEARLFSGYTQAELARLVGTKQPSIARIERGSILPSLTFLEKIAHALGTYLTAPKFGFMEERKTENSKMTVVNERNNTYQFGFYTSTVSPQRNYAGASNSGSGMVEWHSSQEKVIK